MIELWKQILHEDLRDEGDITTKFLGIQDKIISGHVIAKEFGVFAGEVPLEALSKLYPDINFIFIANDGETFEAHDILMEIDGTAKNVLEIERSLINVLQMLCGIATTTKEWVDSASPVNILDTRKTHPLLRGIEKYAVSCGGGVNHRFGLFDRIMIKDNHLALIDNLDDIDWSKDMVVEVDNYDLLEYILQKDVSWIMLDNWNHSELIETIAWIRKEKPKCKIEVSGGINIEDIPTIKSAKPDFISTSKITLGARSTDISLNIIT